MRTKLVYLLGILILAGCGDARPQKPEPTQGASPGTSSEGWRPVEPSNPSKDVRADSSTNADGNQRHLKDLQYIDQSLRTVATQLLNVSSHDDKTDSNYKPEKNEASLIKEVNTEISNLESMGIGFGRPINSKFAYFESSHPGQAMAMTEEELEKEISSTRLMTAYKNHPTTTGGISTWILLNPPSTTTKPGEAEKKTKQPVETEVRITAKPVNTMERVETTEKVVEKLTPVVSSTVYVEKVPSPSTKKPVTTTRRTTPKPEKTEVEKSEPVSTTTTKTPLTSTESSQEQKEDAPTIGTTKKPQVARTTPKPKVNGTKSGQSSKPSSKPPRPSQAARPKPSTKRTTVRPEIVKSENASTAKIEKVTFRPVQMITTPKSRVEATERPMFVTKIKASVLMDAQKATTTAAPSTTTTSKPSTTEKVPLDNADMVEVPVRSKPIGTKVNNVLKVQLKKPVEEATKIEIEPIKVNAPVLKIEKVEKDQEMANKETEALDNSRIDLKFDFNPELTKISVDTSTETSTSSTTASTTSTTKRPRHNSKRKKNKGRRRKPSTVPASTTTLPTTTALETRETETSTELEILDVGIQESKVAPETKVATNSTKTKKKPPQKSVSTQIYNFLSREVMPSFGVMSLVGLGLGLASYFLYPFGGTIARRNYEVEPKYKYNLDEYGGNYGQSEEEVLSKVLQGMTTNENKYGIKDYENNNNNYYRYQAYDAPYDPHSTKKVDRYPPISSSPIYRPENTPSGLKYRNTDYRLHPDVQSTPNYYDRQRHPEYVVAQDHSSPGNRQFVVGSVPKDYQYDEKSPALSTTEKHGPNQQPTESGQTQFEKDMAQGFTFPGNPLNVAGYGHGESQTQRTDEGYEEIEITPTAVAVEHGPRALRVRRYSSEDMDSPPSRSRRDSVIQVIPSKKELEIRQEEEDLSNEILDIIDSALPVSNDYTKPKKIKEENEVEDLEAQRRKKLEEEKTRVKETTKASIVETSTIPEPTVSSSESTSEDSKDVTESSGSSTSPEESETNSEGTSSTTDANTVEWIEITTKEPEKPPENRFNLFSFVKKVAEIKFRLGLTLLKHASEGFARYLGNVQKRINGEE